MLQVLAQRGPSGVTEVAKELAVHRSTVFRMLTTLEARGLVEQDVDRGNYRLGHGLVSLASGVTPVNDVSVLSRPIAHELAAATGETVNVVVSEGTEVMTVSQVLGAYSVANREWVGRRGPMHATAAGKLFLADLEPAEVEAIIDRGLTSYTEHTLVDPDDLRADLERVRARGYAVTFEEHEVGLVAVGAPIRRLDGTTVAAITIAGPGYRVNEKTLPDLAPLVLDAGVKASWRLGFPKTG